MSRCVWIFLDESDELRDVTIVLKRRIRWASLYSQQSAGDGDSHLGVMNRPTDVDFSTRKTRYIQRNGQLLNYSADSITLKPSQYCPYLHFFPPKDY